MLSTVRWPEPALSEAEGFPPVFWALTWESRWDVLTQFSVKNRREPWPRSRTRKERAPGFCSRK
jgi:hypothetical protein